MAENFDQTFYDLFRIYFFIKKTVFCGKNQPCRTGFHSLKVPNIVREDS